MPLAGDTEHGCLCESIAASEGLDFENSAEPTAISIALASGGCRARAFRRVGRCGSAARE